jgi:predicted transcriptional regulator
MPIIAIELDDARTVILDAIANDQKRSRKAQTLQLLEEILDSMKDQVTELLYPENGPECGE